MSGWYLVAGVAALALLIAGYLVFGRKANKQINRSLREALPADRRTQSSSNSRRTQS